MQSPGDRRRESAAATIDGDSTAADRLQAAANLYRAGRIAEAERLCRDILAAEPANVPAAVLCAQATAHRGELKGAIDLLQAALRLKPNSVPGLNGLSVLSLRLGQLDAAKAACQRCLAVDPNNVVALFNLGQVADAAGRPAEAVAAYRRSVELNAKFTAPLVPLALALQKLGKPSEAIAAYTRVPAGDRSEFMARFNLGLLLQGEGRLAEAITAFSRAIEINPADPAPRFQLGGVFYGMGRFDEAADAYRRVVEQKPDMAGAYGNLAKALWARGDATGALAICDDGLRQRPGDTTTVAFKAALLRETGDTPGAGVLVDFERLLKPVRIAAPPGFGSVAEFNAAMTRFAREHPTLVFEPRNHATKGGGHTGDLMLQPQGPMVAFAEAVEGAVRQYRQELSVEAGHPFSAGLPPRLWLSAWAVVMEGQGYQTPHIHPQAWLSGVYYASVPAEIASAVDRAGWIEFGEPLADYRFTAKPELRLIRPEEGLMLLFPSYFYHRTLPFSAGGTRVSIAFDVGDRLRPGARPLAV